MISTTASKPDIAERMLARRVTRWVHSTGTTPRTDGYSPDAECIEAAAEIKRLRAMLSMPRLMHACDALGAPADGAHCELLRRAMTDLELLHAAAKAAGYTVRLVLVDGSLDIGADVPPWNSITDDGDAFRLAMKMHMNLLIGDYGTGVRIRDSWTFVEAHTHGGIEAATRRAITRAAAAIAEGVTP